MSIFPTGIVSALRTFLAKKLGDEMMFPQARSSALKRVLASNIAITNEAGDPFQKLLKPLGVRELNVLKKDPELIQRIKDVVKLDADDIREYMLASWGLRVESCQDDDWWADIEDIRDKLPEWTRAVVEGSYIPGENFLDWGRSLLMEEVRVNINIRRIEELKVKLKEERAKEQEEAMVIYARSYGIMGQCGPYI